jgi:hypothetical protein
MKIFLEIAALVLGGAGVFWLAWLAYNISEVIKGNF